MINGQKGLKTKNDLPTGKSLCLQIHAVYLKLHLQIIGRILKRGVIGALSWFQR